MDNKEKQKILDKVRFYNANEIVAHVLTVPKGTFKNGMFVSDLELDSFFWFIERESSTPIRIFLTEIYDIEDYMEEGK